MSYNSKQRGFTLIELSIVILVVSIFAGIAVNFLGKKNSADKYTETQKKLDFIADAVKAYRQANSSIPCPSSATAALDDAAFGKANCATSTNISQVYNPSGNINVYIGAVPFVDLAIPADYMFDAWGNRLAYVMDNDLGNATSYNDINTTDVRVAGDPNINIIVCNDSVSGCGRAIMRSITTAEKSLPGTTVIKDCFYVSHTVSATDYKANNLARCAAFVVLSRGPNGYKAYGYRGTLNPLTYGYSGTYEVVNAGNKIFIDAPRNTDGKAAASNSYFDDIIVYKTKTWLDN